METIFHRNNNDYAMFRLGRPVIPAVQRLNRIQMSHIYINNDLVGISKNTFFTNRKIVSSEFSYF